MNFNSAINAIQDVQQVAQEALPVIPNNGNPAGAYNNPRTPVVAQPMAKPQVPQLSDRYPWLKPSPSMENVRAMLTQRRQPQQQRQAPVLPARRFIP